MLPVYGTASYLASFLRVRSVNLKKKKILGHRSRASDLPRCVMFEAGFGLYCLEKV